MKVNEILSKVYTKALSIEEAMSLILAKGEGAVRQTFNSVAAADGTEYAAIEPYFSNHTIQGRAVLIGAYLLALAMERAMNTEAAKYGARLKNFVFLKPITAIEPGFSLEVNDTAGKLEIMANGSVTATATLAERTDDEAGASFSIHSFLKQGDFLSAEAFFTSIERCGIVNQSLLKCVARAVNLGNCTLAELNTGQAASPFRIAPAAINAGYAAFLNTLNLTAGQPVIMLGVKNIIIQPRTDYSVKWVIAERKGKSDLLPEADIFLLNERAELVAILQDLQARPTGIPHEAIQSEPAHDPFQQMQQYLIQYISAVLNRPVSRSEMQTPFLQLGLDSGQLIKTVAGLESDLKVSLYPTLFFEYQNIEELAGYLSVYTSNLPAKAKKPEPLPAPPVPAPEPEPVVKPEASVDREIAVIGIGGRFPMADSPAAFLEHLRNVKDMVGEIPASRWDMEGWYSPEKGNGKSYSRWGGFLNQITGFDAAFFHISPREAKTMDPQLRLLLQVMYETAENAGKIRNIRGSNTGLYVGSCFREYWDEMVRLHKPVDIYDLTGSAMTFFANRPSYYFNLKGPSINIDDACSSSLVAIHLACQALRDGDCEMAFVAGVNLLISPLHYQHFCSLEALSPQGRCLAFEASADGYVPAESVCAVLLKPLTDALRDGDPVLGVIKGSSTNHGGKANSLTAPSIQQQTALLVKAWKNAGIDPSRLTYLEAHGTGTRLGDPIEVKALNIAFKNFTEKKSFCALGSAKAHMGHAEGAAGLVSLIKVLLMMQDELIPAMPLFNTVNPLLELHDSPLYVNGKNEAWRCEGKKLAGISSFGMGGAYAHVVVEEPPACTPIPSESGQQVVLAFSAFTEMSLKLFLERFCNFLKLEGANYSLDHLSYALLTAKESFAYRLAWTGNSRRQLVQDLDKFLKGEPSPLLISLAGQISTDKFKLLRNNCEDAAQAWLSGRDIDTAFVWPDGWPVISKLPNYVFQEQDYWFDIPSAGQVLAPADKLRPGIKHPLLGQVSWLENRIVFSGTIHIGHPLLCHHRILGKNILPGVAQLEMVIAAGWHIRGNRPSAIFDHYWYAPMVAEADIPIQFTLTFEEQQDRLSYTLESDRVIFSTGILSFDKPSGRPEPLELENFLADECVFRKGHTVFEQIRLLGAEIGPLMQTVVQGYGKENASLVEWKRNSLDDASGYIYRPALLDAFNHGVRWVKGISAENWKLKVPYHLVSLELFADSLPDAGFIFTELGGDGERISCSACDSKGNILYQVKGFYPRTFEPLPRNSVTPVHTTQPGNESIMIGFKELVAEVLEQPLSAIRDHAPLSEYGLDSVGISQFIRKINSRFSINLNPSVFFEHKTLAAFTDFFNRQFPGKLEPGPSLPTEAQVVLNQSFTPWAPASGNQHLTKVTGSGEMAIIGMDGIFPNSRNPEELWNHLMNGDDLISEIPADRFDWRAYRGDVTLPGKMVTRSAGVMSGIQNFDARFFGISSFEAALMDPQQRLLLQTVYRAIEHAGYAPASLRGSSIGVFIGAVNNEYYELLNENGIDWEGHTATGMARSILPNRVSSFFDWTGPSEAVDTACSSSLVAIHRAIQSIENGECEMAVAGGCNLLLTPKLFVSFSKAGMLAEDGRCRVFDADAGGYVRGEGIGVIVIRKKENAVLNGDPILALIKASGVNHGGHTNSLTTPNPDAQAQLLRSVWQKAGVHPSTIGYIEAHGTGTPLGDPIEINGIIKALGAWKSDQKTLGVGSVKSNIGHLESAAGIAGIVKVILAMRHKTIPASIHYTRRNPLIEIADSPLYITGQSQPWTRINDQIPLRAGVSSFGFGGANAHILLEEYPAHEPETDEEKLPLLFLLSAKSHQSLRKIAQRLKEVLMEDRHAVRDIAFTLSNARDQHSHRLAWVAGGKDSALREIEKFLGGMEGTYLAGVADDIHSPLLSDGLSMQQLVATWIKGGIYHPGYWASCKRINLPGYEFDEIRHWFLPESPAPVLTEESTPGAVTMIELEEINNIHELAWL